MSITEELTKELLEELNCDTAFTIPLFGGIAVPESVVVTWIIMALLIVISILLTRNLKVRNPGKVQLALESGYQLAENFFGELSALSDQRIALYRNCQPDRTDRFQTTYQRYGCHCRHGNSQYFTGRICRHTPEGNQRMVEEFY